MMKKIFLVIIALIIKINLYGLSAINSQMSDPERRMIQLKSEVSINLTQNLLPYWSTRMVDNVNEGFYGRINGNEQVFPDEDKGGILNARILWTYSAAEGLQSDGSLIYEKDLSTGHLSSDRSWWAEAETVVVYLNAYELTGNDWYEKPAKDI
ncbi:MAG TPA: hypothetical protein VMV77_14490 [Bacteroidales bacterium]|nr:hypothetical protein [Bacteroidales bacterium]